MKTDDFVTKKTIYPVKIGKRFLFGLGVCIAGFICLLLGCIKDYRYKNVISFEELNEENCKEGQFVKGEIEDLIYNKLRDGTIDGVSKESMNGVLTVYTYTVYCQNDELIRVYVNSPKKHREFKNILINGTVKFEGEIIKDTSKLNYDWYNNVGVDDTDNIITEYSIKQSNIHNGMELIGGGLGLIVVGIGYLMIYCECCRNGVIYK